MKKIFLQQPLLSRFFKVLKNKKPKLFYFFLLFLILQLVTTFLKIEITPFLLYGMYSEKTPDTGNYKQQLILLNGHDIHSYKIPPSERMLLVTAIENYLKIKQNGNKDIVQSRVESIYTFLTNSFIYPSIEDKIYNKPDDLRKFESWFKEKCSKIVHRKIHKVSVIQRQHVLNRKYFSFKTISSDTIASF